MYPSLAVDPEGNVHVAWQDDTDYGGAGTDIDIFYRMIVIPLVIGGEELPLDSGAVLASMLCSYCWIPVLMVMALVALYVNKCRR